MATYYGVTAVRARGEKFLSWEKFSGDTMPQPSISSGKRLIAIKQDPKTEIACDVTSTADWSELLEAYRDVAFSRCEFYLLHEHDLVHCPNEGRVPVA